MIPGILRRSPNVEGDDAATALAELAPGLVPELLTAAVVSGVRAAGNITRAHPVTARGYTLWADTVGALRASLVERGWTLEDPANSPLIVSPDDSLSIVPIRGNAATGVSRHSNPATARYRGPATVDAARSNMQLSLNVDDALTLLRDEAPRQRWALLYNWSDAHPEIRAELSLPVLTASQRAAPARTLIITAWHHRILLPPVDTSDFSVPTNTIGPDDVDFDIEEIS